MSKKPKSVAKTEPTLYETPYGGLRYLLIQDHKQLKQLEDDLGVALRATLPREHQSHFRATTWFKCVEGIGAICVIYYPDLLIDSPQRAAVTLCHECVHVWQFFHKDIIFEAQPSDEFEAYTIDEIFGNMLDEYEKLLSIHEKNSKQAEIGVPYVSL